MGKLYFITAKENITNRKCPECGIKIRVGDFVVPYTSSTYGHHSHTRYQHLNCIKLESGDYWQRQAEFPEMNRNGEILD